jgi:ABC-type Fe3+/spermidine/putrescine transport system ATPase subunit
MANNPYIEFKNIIKKFNDCVAVDNVSLSIPRGAFVTLLGPSGCGKTTLMRQLAGFLEPEAGDITIGGKRVNGLPPYKRNTPLVFQEYALFPHMTIFENISYGLKIQKIPMEQRREKVADMLRMFNLEGLEKRFPKELSGGQQQRVAFARALVMGQDILLMDEPLSNLDAKLRVEVRTELRQIQRKLKITTIYVTHDQDEALSMSDIIAVMRKGKIEQIGTPWEIYFKPANRFVADFIGVVNFLKATVERVSDEGTTVRFLDSQIDVRTEKKLVPGQEVTLTVRPECLSFTENAEKGNILGGEVADSSFLGRMTRYWVRAAGQEFIVDETNPSSFEARVGRVFLALDTSKIHLLTEDECRV